MSLESIRDAIDHLSDRSPAEFAQTIKSVLMSKLTDRMDVEKVSIASQMFGDSTIAQETSETPDE
jgi:hypothetical protein